jgi:hypothetical protein
VGIRQQVEHLKQLAGAGECPDYPPLAIRTAECNAGEPDPVFPPLPACPSCGRPQRTGTSSSG